MEKLYVSTQRSFGLTQFSIKQKKKKEEMLRKAI